MTQGHFREKTPIQGGGKSYTLGTIAEMATMPVKNINQLPQSTRNGDISLQSNTGLSARIHFNAPPEFRGVGH